MRAVMGLGTVLVLGYVAPLFFRSLWNPDEPRTGTIAWAMARPGGDWLVPSVNGSPWVQVPPLHDWLAALSVRAFGGGPGRDWAVRAPAMAFALATVILTAVQGRRLFGPRAGLLAALVLASTAEYIWVANRAGPDGALTFFVTVAACQALWIAREPSLSLRRCLIAGLAAGLAFLSKNLLGPVYLALISGALLISRRDLLRRRAAWLAAGAGLLAFAAVALPWPALLYRRDPSLLRGLLWENALARFASIGHQGHHNTPFFEFWGRVLLDLLPWTPLLLPALWALARDAFRRPPSDLASRPLLAWAALPALLVAASTFKRDLYLLPIYPALALSLGAYLDGAIRRAEVPGTLRAPRFAVPAALALALAMAAGNLALCRIQDPSKSYAPLGTELRALRDQGFALAGYRLGLREVCAMGYQLSDLVLNLEDPARAEAFLAKDAPPAALVVERRTLEAGAPAGLREAPRRSDFPVSRGIVVLRNRP